MESMRTLNHNEKRVVSFFIWDPELEKKIDREVKMIDGISKLLNVATTLEQTIECNKALVLSQQRMLAFMAEIQRKQQNLLKSDKQNLEPTKATVILSDIKLPLVWANMKARSEQKKFAIFCLARIGCEIIDTALKHIDKKSTEIVFNDKLTFTHVPHDFELHLEVYALNKSLALSSSAKEFANRYSYFSTYGSQKVTESNSHHSKSSVHPKSKFVLIARTTFNKISINKTAKVYDLKIEPAQENPLMHLPIHSSFISKLIIQPLCYTYPSVFAGIVIMNNGQYTCSLTAGYLTGEEIVQDDGANQHRFSIPIASDTVILASDDQLLFVIDNQDLGQVEFFVEDSFILRNWVRALHQHIVDIRTWESTLECLPSKKEQPCDALCSLVKSSTVGTNFTKESLFPTEIQIIDDLHPSDISAQITTTNGSTQLNHTNYFVDKLNVDTESPLDAAGYKIRI